MNLKTLRMLEAALATVGKGASGIIVVPGMNDVRPAALALSARDYGGVWDCRISKYKTSKGGILFIMPMRNDAVDRKGLRVRGYPDELVFWDHEVVKEAHAKLIAEYHRYD